MLSSIDYPVRWAILFCVGLVIAVRFRIVVKKSVETLYPESMEYFNSGVNLDGKRARARQIFSIVYGLFALWALLAGLAGATSFQYWWEQRATVSR